MKKFRGTTLFLSFMLIFFLAAAGAVSSFAAGGDGSGSGGGSSVALAMVSSTPSDGASGISTTPVISCRFSHNVAEASVSASNLSHLSLKKADGTPIDIRTYVADVQIEFDKRQYLYAKPSSALEPGTTYILTLSPGIQAKNGMTTSSAQTVTFTTAGTAPQTENEAPAGDRDNSSQTAVTADQTGGSGTAAGSAENQENISSGTGGEDPAEQNALAEDENAAEDPENAEADEKDTAKALSENTGGKADGEDISAGAESGAADESDSAGNSAVTGIIIFTVIAVIAAAAAFFAIRRKTDRKER